MIKKILLFFFIFIALINIAAAESGTLYIDAAVGNSYYAGGSVGSGADWEPTSFYFDTANYNSVSKIELIDSRAVFSNEADSTTFTCGSGCEGGGTVTYSAVDKKIVWYFNDGFTVSSSPFTVTYTNASFFDPIQIEINGITFTKYYDTANVDSSKPVCIKSQAGSYCASSDDPTNAFYFIVQTGKTVSNNYTVSYSSPNLFTVDIDKSGAVVATKVEVKNATSSLFQETTYNTDDYSFTHEYDNGILLSMSTSDGYYDNVTVNTTDSTFPTPAPTPTINPDTKVGFLFDKSQYYVGDTVNVSIINENSAPFTTYKYYIYNNEKELTSSQIPSSSFYVHVQAEEIGYIKVVVQACVLLCSDLDSAQVNVVPESPSWISLENNTVYTFTPINVSYHIGYSTEAPNIEIGAVSTEWGNLADVVYPEVFPDGTVNLSVVRHIPEGEYMVELYDNVKGEVLDSKSLTVVRNPVTIPKMNIDNSYITTDKSYYNFNEIATIEFAIDDINFTNYSIRGEIYNVNKSITTMRIYSAFGEQVGSFQTLLNSNRDKKCELSLNCWVETGINRIKLVAYNSTDSFEITNATFQVASTTIDGYGLLLSSSNISTNDVLTITTIVPSGKTGRLRIKDSGYGANAYSIYNRTAPAGTHSYQLKITRVNALGEGYYDVELWDTTTATLKVVVPLTVYAYEPSEDLVAPSSATMVDTLLNSKYYWAMFVIVTCLGIGALVGGAGMMIGTGVGVTMSYLLGWMPVWIVFLYAVLLIATYSYGRRL